MLDPPPASVADVVAWWATVAARWYAAAAPILRSVGSAVRQQLCDQLSADEVVLAVAGWLAGRGFHLPAFITAGLTAAVETAIGELKRLVGCH